MDLLLAVVGACDPWQRSPLADTELAGPILIAERAAAFDGVLLLAPSETLENAEGCRDAIRGRGSEAEVAVIPLPPWGDVMADGLARVLESAGWAERVGRAAANGSVSILVGRDQAAVQSLLVQFADAHLAAYRLLDVIRPDIPSTHPPRLVEVHPPAEGPGPQGVREPAAVYGKAGVKGSVTAEARPGSEDGRRAGIAAAMRKLRLVADHPSMDSVWEIVDAVAPHRVPVLIQGDTGTGKGLVARLIHDAGEDPDSPFVAVNCGALPSQLIESQLFGHCRGSFTGATRDQSGKFVLADGGTLFLDEVGEMPIDLQPKLLRVLEDGVVEPIGATRGVRVNVRIVAATNRDLAQAVREGRFRKDLYYRLAFALIRMPLLSRRRSDIAPLALHFMERINQSLRSPRQITPEALQVLERQPWPGNVRELENVIGRSALLCPGPVIGPKELVLDDASGISEAELPLPDPHPGFRLDAYLLQTRERLALRAMELAGGKQNQAAKLLGMSPQGISRILQAITKKRED